MPSLNLSNWQNAAARPPAHVIGSDTEAIEIAQRLAIEFAAGAAKRDRERILPVAEIDTFSQSGLWAMTVPKAFGGADVSYATVAKIFEIISAADGSIGQIPQNHISVLFQVRAVGTPAQQEAIFGRVLRGARFGNALAELTANAAHIFTTTMRKVPGGYKISGRKFYSTGALFVQHEPIANGAVAQIMQAAIDSGIAVAAVADTMHIVRTIARPWRDAESADATQDPYTIAKIGRLNIDLHAAQALLQRAGRLVDAAISAPTDASVAEASIAVAVAKVATTEIALKASSTLFELGGTRTTLADQHFDRHWRNARVHTLHDPVRWKYHVVGNHALNGIAPPRHGLV